MMVNVTIQGQISNGNVSCLLYNFKTFKDFLYKYNASINDEQRKETEIFLPVLT